MNKTQIALKDIFFKKAYKEDSLHCYGIFDAAKIDDLALMLDIWGVEYASLFLDEIADELEDVSPFLVKLNQNNKDVDALFSEYGEGNCLFLISDRSFQQLLDTFRDLFNTYSQYNELSYFRFFDPVIFRHYIKLIKSEKLELFFVDVTFYYCQGVFPDELEYFQLTKNKLINKTVLLSDHKDQKKNSGLRYDLPANITKTSTSSRWGL